MQKTAKLKQVDNRIITLKREISKLKDILAEYGTYQGFLSDLSPQSFREKQKQTQQEVELEQFSIYFGTSFRLYIIYLTNQP